MASIGLRGVSGNLIFATADHAAKWQIATTAKSSDGLLPVNVEIFDHDKVWGRLELTFKPDPVSPQRELLALFIFVTASCMLGFILFMKRTLHILDPSQVIPERVRAMLDTLAEGAAIVDGDGRIVLANQSLAGMLNTARDQLLGVRLAELPWVNRAPQNADSDPQPIQLPWDDFSNKVDCRGKMVQLKTEAGSRSLVVNASSILDGRHGVRGGVFTFDDVTGIEQKNQQLVEMVQQLGHAQQRVQKQNEELQRLATRDALTGCLNRRAFHEHLASLFAAAKRQKQPLSAIMLDIDHFKSINDNHGHARGDEVLRGVAEILRKSVRGADVVCRYGGEEFCILTPATDIDGAFALAEKLRQAVSRDKIFEIAVTASLGVSCTSLGITTTQALIDQADEALYNSKNAGRNLSTRFDRLDPSVVKSEDKAETIVSGEEPIPIQAVRSLFAALSFRDPNTAQHSKRVSEMCVKVGSTFLSGRELLIIETAGLLHDIGKVGVPDAVLLKPGPLNKEEWRLMHEHDRMGAEIIQTAFSCPQLSAIIAHHHARHEWITDSGKLGPGEFIPLCARLLAIADAYDAMTTYRCYRAAMSTDAAVAELRRCAGTQFDPHLVEQFIRIVVVDSSDASSAQAESDRLAQTLRLSMEAEMLATKLLERDLESTAAIAHHLAQTAASLGSDQVAEQCSLITRSLESAADTQTLLAQTRDLLECVAGRETHGSDKA